VQASIGQTRKVASKFYLSYLVDNELQGVVFIADWYKCKASYILVSNGVG
jgi:hypothetical protein